MWKTLVIGFHEDMIQEYCADVKAKIIPRFLFDA